MTNVSPIRLVAGLSYSKGITSDEVLDKNVVLFESWAVAELREFGACSARDLIFQLKAVGRWARAKNPLAKTHKKWLLAALAKALPAKAHTGGMYRQDKKVSKKEAKKEMAMALFALGLQKKA